MNKKIDLIIKIFISAAIILTLILIALPVLEERGIISPDSEDSRTGGMPSGPPNNAPRGAGRTSQPDLNKRAQAVEAFTVIRGTVSNYIRVNGDVVTEIEIELFPNASGQITDIDVSVGDFVLKDQIVAYVDPSLPGQKFAPSPVYSTISGTVLSINEETGDKVSTNTSIMTVGDLTNLKLVTYVPEKYSGSLEKGLPAEVSFSAFPEEPFRAVISEISPVIDASSRTAEVTLKLAGNLKKIKTGMFASIKLVTEQTEDITAIPADAVFTYYGKDTVFVVNKNNTAERRPVTVGLKSTEMVEISEGLAEGEIVVTEGQSLLSEGSSVKIVK